MFSFAVWVSVDKKLFAARDRFGVKPFYYHQSEDTLYFSSEIKTLHSAGIAKEPNKKVWANYFSFGSYGMPHETFWKHIDQLPGGHCLEFEKNTLKIEKWYFFEKEIEKHKEKLSYEEIKNKYIVLLKDSIKLRFRADVSVGFNVSGGLDSSALLAFVNQQENKENIKAFTFYTNDDRYDELPWVEEMVSLTENSLQKVLLKPEEVKEVIEELTIEMSKHGIEITEDKAAITLTFKDGSFGTILYLANGGKLFAKERIEVFANNGVLQLDNFRKLTGYDWPGFKKDKLMSQDKGQDNCSKAFVSAISTGIQSPIHFDEIMEVARVSVDIAESLRK
jgi:asparagine synthetase B (glutamine-hydrolysing)